MSVRAREDDVAPGVSLLHELAAIFLIGPADCDTYGSDVNRISHGHSGVAALHISLHLPCVFLVGST